MSGYDIIGDVHGKAEALRALLAKLGYQDSAGAHRQSNRKAIFVGDWVDRGPAIRECLLIVRNMVEAGEAHAVIGNHEYNLLNYHYPDGRGGFRRKHDAKNDAMVALSNAFLDAFPEEREGWLDWLKRQSLFLDLGQLRVVHAQWMPCALPEVKEARSLLDAGYDEADFMGSLRERAIDQMLKGAEIRLPQGCHVPDRAGSKRKKLRVKWWLNGEGLGYHELAVLHGDEVPKVPPPSENLAVLSPYPVDAPPVFMGHYGFRDFPGRLAANVACVDYERDGNGGIGAYRWSGEQEINDEHFV